MKKAALINASGKYSKVLLSVIVNAVLARILSADDYGIVAIITVFSTFFATFSDMGFGPAIIQNKELTKEDISNIYSFTVYISFALMVLFAICSYPIAIFYGNKVYISLGLMLSVALLFDALNMVPNGILNRDKRFAMIAVRTVSIYVVSAIITIILAFIGLRYYALAIQAILTALLTFVWNYITTKPRFVFHFEIKSIKKVLNYSGYQFAFNLVNYFSRNLDNLLTGKFMGDADLGYYNKAYTLMLYPVNNLTGVITPVLHPILSDYQKELEIVYEKYIRVFRLLFCMGIFVAPFCYLGSAEIISIMYGSGWQKSVVCFQLLSIAIIPQMLNSSSGGIFQAIGNTRLLFLNGCINTVITIIAILIGVFYGKSITALSLCVAVAYIMHLITATYMLICMGFKYRLSRFIKDVSKEIIILLGMIFAVSLYNFVISDIILSFIIKLVYLGAIFTVLLILTGEFRLLLSFVKK